MSEPEDEAEARQRAFNEAFERVKPRIEELVGEVAECVTSIGPLSWRVTAETALDPDTKQFRVEHWDLYVYEGLTEFMGGKNDGAMGTSGITVTLSEVAKLLENDEDNPAVIEASSEPHCCAFGCNVIYLCGLYEGIPLTLFILLDTPNDEEAPTGRLHQDGSMELCDDGP